MSIYRFRDTIERAMRDGYPAEALNFNGIYFEDEIEGYQTLAVTGRESLEAEIDTIETSAMHGARFRSSRYLPRVITVRYKLRSKNASDLIEKYNRLNYLLGTEEAKLIFRDEPDKFWTGTRRNLTPPEVGMLTTTGEIEFLCADPFKYSVREYEAAATDNRISVRYNGTQPNPPRFRVLAHGDIAFVELLKDMARVAVGENRDAWSEDAQGGTRQAGAGEGLIPFVWNQVFAFWKYGQFPYLDDDPLHIAALKDNWIEYWTEDIDGEPWMVPFRPGSMIPDDSAEARSGGNAQVVSWGTEGDLLRDYLDGKRWAEQRFPMCGTGRGYPLGDLLYKNFILSFESRMFSESAAECGIQSFGVYASGTHEDAEEGTEESYIYPAFGIDIRKNISGTNRLELVVYVDGDVVDTIIMSSLPSNEVFGRNSLRCSLTRLDRACTLRLGNESYTYESSLAPMPVYVGIYACDYCGMANMACNAIRYIKFQELSAKTAKDMQSIIRDGSEVIIDCAKADIMVNGISEPELGDIMNQWDEMDLVLGENNIGINMIRSASEKEPEVTMLYREAYI